VTKVLAIRATDRGQGEFVVTSLHEAAENKRIELDDIALISHDPEGKLELHKTSGRFHRHKIDDGLLKRVGAQVAPPEVIVLAKGDDAMIDAVGARVRTLTGGDMKTYEVADGELREVTGTESTFALSDHEGLLRESSDDLPTPSGIMVKMPIS
jgi:hypothetical protein